MFLMQVLPITNVSQYWSGKLGGLAQSPDLPCWCQLCNLGSPSTPVVSKSIYSLFPPSPNTGLAKSLLVVLLSYFFGAWQQETNKQMQELSATIIMMECTQWVLPTWKICADAKKMIYNVITNNLVLMQPLAKTFPTMWAANSGLSQSWDWERRV